MTTSMRPWACRRWRLLFEEASSLGVELIACQSGLHLMGVDILLIDPRVGVGGLVSCDADDR